jgi:hypothetical protein
MRKPTRKDRRRFEPLEPRQLLAGNVTVELIDGDLIVTGDGLDNRIGVYGPAGNLSMVEGENDGQGNATSINGVPNGRFNLDELIGDVIIRMADGNDTVFFTGPYSGAFVIEGGQWR